MLRKGFTLIELLIVITIVAILAGAAVPFVQDYVEDARLAKVRADLDEIKNALARYELDTGKLWVSSYTTDLIGPYLAKAMFDPWGTPYAIHATGSTVFSAGPDRASGTVAANIDNVSVDFRPPLAPTKAYYIDADKSGTVNVGDQIKLRFTRVVDEDSAKLAGNYGLWEDGDTASSAFVSDAAKSTSDGRDVVLTISSASPLPAPGIDMIGVATSVVDLAKDDECGTSKVLIKAL